MRHTKSRTTAPPLSGAFLAIAAGIFYGCSVGSPSGGAERVASGTWGGRGVSLQVSDRTATVEYDCAGGTIDEPLALDSQGRFDAKGTHFQERPGPQREGEEPERQPARYTGRIEGKTMTYSVTIGGTDQALGPYSLTYGEAGVLRKCK